MNKRFLQITIGLGIFAQFAVVGLMIVRYEQTLRLGTACRFNVRPVDPYDPIKGCSVALSPANEVITTNEFKNAERVFAVISLETNGMAWISGVSRQRPPEPLYFKTRVSYCTQEYRQVTNKVAKARQKPYTQTVLSGTWRVYLDIPFNEYFLPEKLAPATEQAVHFQRQSSVVAVVRLWHGRAVIEGLEINGQPLRDFLKAKAEKEVHP